MRTTINKVRCSALQSFVNSNKYIIYADFRNRNFVQPDSGFRWFFYKCFHFFIHFQFLRREAIKSIILWFFKFICNKTLNYLLIAVISTLLFIALPSWKVFLFSLVNIILLFQCALTNVCHLDIKARLIYLYWNEKKSFARQKGYDLKLQMYDTFFVIIFWAYNLKMQLSSDLIGCDYLNFWGDVN